MKNGIWQLKDNGTICILVNGEFEYFPTALEIFYCEFKSVPPIAELTVQKPSTELGLTFSKYPVPVKLVIEQDCKSNSFQLVAKLYCRFRDQYIAIAESRDYIITDNEWFPFEPGAIDEILVELESRSIVPNSQLTLKQYLTLRKSNLLFLDDRVDHSFNTKQFITADPEEIPFFSGALFPYQMQGYKWLKMVSQEDAGCILADEMGLGKTAQVIALLAMEKHLHNKTSLVVAPVTLMENWRRELLKFAPLMTNLIHQGNNRTGLYSNLLKYDVVITTYETVMRDLSMFLMAEWNMVVIDEAQAIKNPDAQRTQSLKMLKRRMAIAVTGTPVENRLTDLWSLMDFVFPGYLGSLREFHSNFPEGEASALTLEPIISPLMLRRRVSEVAGDLPERIDVPQFLEFSLNEAETYEVLRQSILEQYGGNSQLVSLSKLRIFCCHPLLSDNGNYDPAEFSKYKRLVELIEEITSSNEKLLIFTTYIKMTDIMMRDLSTRFKVFIDYIDGRVAVADRQPIIDKFSKHSGSAILILNPKAAGAGLNITAANHVIHYNLEWNPAVEDQASARAFRRGQTRPVTVHRLYIANTVEEVINDRVQRKRVLADEAVVGTDGSMDQAEILQALSRSPLERSSDK
ncbi:DEAD/DEAH box helicase [Paenibacillus nanensis]|uniref:DEAD/DEAH box helicase n=1 Tax=Paenibacillus nanensis TaxID=393251 RepID=A0A3A1VIM3_9BACL|nr:DEAD/DEAH box helicase [Paenibacillus nanensis]RIX60105.1 DEAD/DEAH box helicase [Paenibacillus nanensis]